MENIAVFLFGIHFGPTGASLNPKARELTDTVNDIMCMSTNRIAIKIFKRTQIR
jgi:hypothetical protein